MRVREGNAVTPVRTDAHGTAGAEALSAVSLTKGRRAIRGIGEKFAANPVMVTGSLSVPVATSLGRSGFNPQLSLSYDSGSGNGRFGIGWSLSIPAITRKTDKGLPRYRDAEESGVYILSGAEVLVPVVKPDGTRGSQTRRVDSVAYFEAISRCAECISMHATPLGAYSPRVPAPARFDLISDFRPDHSRAALLI